MKIKSFGCSFIFGSDLSDIKNNRTLAIYSQLTWPALLAQKLGYDYECYAKPASGNLQILDQILTQLADPTPSIFVINWSWIDRFDYYLPDWETQSKSNPWQTIIPGNEDSITNTYYKNLHSEYQDKLTTLINIRTAVDLLIQKKTRHIMTYMDDLVFDQTWHTTPSTSALQEYVAPYMTTFDNETFLNWSRRHGYPESAGWHPLEAAHKAAADYMIKVFDKQKINGLTQ